MNYNSETDLSMYILNEKNIYITKNDIENMLKEFDIIHKVKNLNNFQTALTHTSYMIRDLKEDRLNKLVKEKDLIPIPQNLEKKAIPMQKESYERLEYLGDSVIHLILANYFYDRFPEEQEGFMTKLRTKIENGQVLAKFTKKIGLNKFVLIARHMEQVGSRETNHSILEDVFEAFIGALFKESNFETCSKLVIKIMEQEIDISDLIFIETNFKDLLLQYYHKMKWPDPVYSTILIKEEKKDDMTRKYFTMCVKGYAINKRGEYEWVPIGHGISTSKKKGEQEAARVALLKFGVIKEADDSQVHEEVYDENDLNYQ